MTKAAQIRELAAGGMNVTDISKAMNIRYQPVRNVLARSALLPAGLKVKTSKTQKEIRPDLTAETLLQAGFDSLCEWMPCETNGIRLSGDVPKWRGVYAFAVDGFVQYVGVASSGFANRLKFYCKPSQRQTTSIRIKTMISETMSRGRRIEILASTPPDTEWNGLVVDGCLGLEYGILKTYQLPWNKTGKKEPRTKP
jgi:hypothetical protein